MRKIIEKLAQVFMGFMGIIGFSFVENQRAQAAVKEKINYVYNKKEFIDLGDLEIKGTLIAPGDISVKERERAHMSRDLLHRLDFQDKNLKDIKNLK
jgi:hypothetical protein